MPDEMDMVRPIPLWIVRLQRKVDELEKQVDTEDDEQFLKDFNTCDTYWKKLYVRAKDFAFSTPDGPQIVRDLGRIKARLEKLRKQLPARTVFRRMSPTDWEVMAKFS